jgi:hypothetical protein
MSGEKVGNLLNLYPRAGLDALGKKNSPVAVGCNLFGAMKKKISHRNHKRVITVKSNCLVNCLASQK